MSPLGDAADCRKWMHLHSTTDLKIASQYNVIGFKQFGGQVIPYLEYMVLVASGFWCFGETAANITIPLRRANTIPKPLTIMDSVECFNTFLFVCKNVNFSNSPVSAVTTAKP